VITADGFHRTDYILQAFSSQLRDLASTDKLIVASGISGGVSGYVHSVLVPELAVSLIVEDKDVSPEAARDILVESADIGDILHGEEEERIPRAKATLPSAFDTGDTGDTEGAIQRTDVFDD